MVRRLGWPRRHGRRSPGRGLHGLAPRRGSGRRVRVRGAKRGPHARPDRARPHRDPPGRRRGGGGGERRGRFGRGPAPPPVPTRRPDRGGAGARPRLRVALGCRPRQPRCSRRRTAHAGAVRQRPSGERGAPRGLLRRRLEASPRRHPEPCGRSPPEARQRSDCDHRRRDRRPPARLDAALRRRRAPGRVHGDRRRRFDRKRDRARRVGCPVRARRRLHAQPRCRRFRGPVHRGARDSTARRHATGGCVDERRGRRVRHGGGAGARQRQRREHGVLAARGCARLAGRGVPLVAARSRRRLHRGRDTRHVAAAVRGRHVHAAARRTRQGRPRVAAHEDGDRRYDAASGADRPGLVGPSAGRRVSRCAADLAGQLRARPRRLPRLPRRGPAHDLPPRRPGVQPTPRASRAATRTRWSRWTGPATRARPPASTSTST